MTTKKKCITCGLPSAAYVGDECLKCFTKAGANAKPRRSIYVVRIHGDWYYDGGDESKHGRMPARKGLGHAYRLKYRKSAIKAAIKYEGEVVEVKESK